MEYDRRVSQELLFELAHGGFRPLVDHASSRNLRDLQFWAHPRQASNRVRLYVGRSGVLDLEEDQGRFRIGTRTAGKYRALGTFDPAWTKWKSSANLAAQWPAIARYLAAVEAAVHGSFTSGEGALHAALCKPQPGFAVIDREAVIGGAQTAAQVVLDEFRDQLATAPRGARGWWRKPPTGLGGEADLVAVDEQGRVLVIEVKAPKSNGDVAWASVQAAGYTALFAAWAQTVGDQAAQVLNGMLHQRTLLGLTTEHGAVVADPPQFVPVVAYGPQRPRPHGLQRLEIVRSVLAGMPATAAEHLQAWHVDTAGRVEVLPA